MVTIDPSMHSFHGTSVVPVVVAGCASVSEVRGEAVEVVVVVVVTACVTAPDDGGAIVDPCAAETAIEGTMFAAVAVLGKGGAVAVAVAVPFPGLVITADVPPAVEVIGARYGCGACGGSCCEGSCCCCGCNLAFFDGAIDPPFPAEPSSAPPVPSFRFFFPLPDPPPPPPLPAPPDAECAPSACKFRSPVMYTGSCSTSG